MSSSVRRGPLRVSYRATPTGGRVLFAVPKSVGTAVVRNRARRRVRAAVRELTGDGTIVLSDGEYRLGVSSSLEGLSAAELRTTLGALLGDVR
jgi:ribonuclease P protein component